MIRELQISNYKSLHELTLEVGRFNVLIGENGCGKSNLLEAITFAGAAAADKLDNEFLVSRGIRVTEPHMMRSAFTDDALAEPVKIDVGYENIDVLAKYNLVNDNQLYGKWNRMDGELNELPALWKKLEGNDENWEKINNIQALLEKVMQIAEGKVKDEIKFNEINSGIAELGDFIQEHSTKVAALKASVIDIAANYFENNNTSLNYFENYERLLVSEEKIKSFLIYSPENSALRNFHKEGQIEPLGINGEGLLKLLKVIQTKSPEQREEIHNTLQLFDWYEELDIPKDLSSLEDKVTITDRYLTQAFDQRSANEGFLFVLFYIALMVSDDTPKIFAIDNIDVALNPKLCAKLIKELVRLAKKYDKQVFVTSHNPAILDGIDLADDEQRLLVASRNKQGHTRFKRIALKDKPRSSSNEEIKLSEAFLRGYLGGLPKGF
ncbi:MAG: AAA family ATPase [Methylococcales bacterium]